MERQLKHRLFSLAVVAGFGLLATQQVNAASFNLSPATGNFIRGCTSQLIVYADATGQTSNAADIEINYDPTQLDIVDSISTSSGTQVEPGDAYGGYIYDQVNTGSGLIKIAAGSAISELSSNKAFIKINFIPKPAATASNFTINFTGSGNTLDSNIADSATSNDLLTSVTNGSYTFSSGACPTSPVTPTPTASPTPTSSVVTTQVVVNGTPTVIILTPTPIANLPQTGTTVNLTVQIIFEKINTALLGNAGPTQLAFAGVALLPLLSLIGLLFILPILNSSTKHYWGIIYERNSRKPLAMAKASLFDLATNKLISSKLSDTKGRYGFVLNEGKYKLVVIKHGYVEYKQELTISKSGDFFSNDIALDLDKHNNLVSLLMLILDNISTNIYKGILGILIFGLVASLVANIFAFNYLTVALIVIYLVLFTSYLVKRAFHGEVKGLVIDAKSKQAVAGVIIKLFNQQKLMEDTAMNSKSGNYTLELEDGDYTVRTAAEGYQQPANTNSHFAVRANKATEGKILLDRRV